MEARPMWEREQTAKEYGFIQAHAINANMCKEVWVAQEISTRVFDDSYRVIVDHYNNIFVTSHSSHRFPHADKLGPYDTLEEALALAYTMNELKGIAK